MTEPRRKRLAWVITPGWCMDNEDWKTERREPAEVQEEIRRELEKENPVIVLPMGWSCHTVELDHPPTEEKIAEKLERPAE